MQKQCKSRSELLHGRERREPEGSAALGESGGRDPSPERGAAPVGVRAGAAGLPWSQGMDPGLTPPGTPRG